MVVIDVGDSPIETLIVKGDSLVNGYSRSESFLVRVKMWSREGVMRSRRIVLIRRLSVLERRWVCSAVPPSNCPWGRIED